MDCTKIRKNILPVTNSNTDWLSLKAKVYAIKLSKTVRDPTALSRLTGLNYKCLYHVLRDRNKIMQKWEDYSRHEICNFNLICNVPISSMDFTETMPETDNASLIVIKEEPSEYADAYDETINPVLSRVQIKTETSEDIEEDIENRFEEFIDELDDGKISQNFVDEDPRIKNIKQEPKFMEDNLFLDFVGNGQILDNPEENEFLECEQQTQTVVNLNKGNGNSEGKNADEHFDDAKKEIKVEPSDNLCEETDANCDIQGDENCEIILEIEDCNDEDKNELFKMINSYTVENPDNQESFQIVNNEREKSLAKNQSDDENTSVIGISTNYDEFIFREQDKKLNELAKVSKSSKES